MKYGKWLAGGLGWAFGGPIGGILGFVLGSVFDNSEEITTQDGRRVGTSRSGDFAASLLVLTAAVMKADNRILKAELDFVKAFFLRQFGEHYAKEQMLVLRELLKQEIPLRDVCLQIKQHIDHPSRLQLLHYLFGIAVSDGEAHPLEIKLIEQIAAYLGISDADFGSIKAMFVKDTQAAYHILEIEKTATDEEVKKAYKKMALKFHPDKVAHLGEEFQKAANEKFQKVNDAFQKIKKERGFS